LRIFTESHQQSTLFTIQKANTMSQSSAKAFIERIVTDEEFRRNLVGELSRYRRDLVKVAGFDFTDEELDEAKADLPPGALGHAAGWFCNTSGAQPSGRERCCGGGLWH
jgi:predicted ribosomally synthesized peptide with nif11-like leader